MMTKHYHVFDATGTRVGPVLEVPADATDEEVMTELLSTHSEVLPALVTADPIRFLSRGQTFDVYGPDDQICMLVHGL
jgi:sporulation protein YlmC with PRC-barrel domain